MRLLIVISVILLGCNNKTLDHENQYSFQKFISSFSEIDMPISADTISIFNLPKPSDANILSSDLLKKHLKKDSLLFYEVYWEHRDSTIIHNRTVQQLGKFSLPDSLVGILYHITAGNKMYNYDMFRVALFKNEKLVNATNIAVTATLTMTNRKNQYMVTALMNSNTISQHKIGIEYHEEPNMNNRMGGSEKYYFSMGDTLATSTLVIQSDGTLVGNNLAKVSLRNSLSPAYD